MNRAMTEEFNMLSMNYHDREELEAAYYPLEEFYARF